MRSKSAERSARPLSLSLSLSVSLSLSLARSLARSLALLSLSLSLSPSKERQTSREHREGKTGRESKRERESMHLQHERVCIYSIKTVNAMQGAQHPTCYTTPCRARNPACAASAVRFFLRSWTGKRHRRIRDTVCAQSWSLLPTTASLISTFWQDKTHRHTDTQRDTQTRTKTQTR